MSENTTPQTEVTERIIPIESVDQLAHLLNQWHQHKLRVLQHMMAIPEGTEVSINEETEHKLEGDVLKGFQIGVSLCLIEFNSLPFSPMDQEELSDDARGLH